jgi:hypothetical protein
MGQVAVSDVDHEAQRLANEQWVAFGLTLHQFRKWPWNCLLAGLGQ